MRSRSAKTVWDASAPTGGYERPLRRTRAVSPENRQASPRVVVFWALVMASVLVVAGICTLFMSSPLGGALAAGGVLLAKKCVEKIG